MLSTKVIVCFTVFATCSLQKVTRPNVHKNCEKLSEFDAKRDLNLALIVKECDYNEMILTKSKIQSAIWIVDRLNTLNYTGSLKLGISAFTACEERKYLETIFRVHQLSAERVYLGVVSDQVSPESRVKNFCKVLDVQFKTGARYWDLLVKTTVKLLAVLEWKENITVVAKNSQILDEFYRYTRREWMCVKCGMVFDDFRALDGLYHWKSSPSVVFGDSEDIRFYINRTIHEQREFQAIFVPLDGTQVNDIPESSYVIQPHHPEYQVPYTVSPNMIPSPILFELANPIINYVQDISAFLKNNCSETIYKLNCFRNKFPKKKNVFTQYEPSDIADMLKIDTTVHTFLYNIFRVENITVLPKEEQNETHEKYVLQTFVKAYTYDIFSEILTDLENGVEVNGSVYPSVRPICSKPHEECIEECVNFLVAKKIVNETLSPLRLRPHPWVFGFWVLSFLGMLFCVSILVFILVKICKRDILEGNPMLTILMLVSTTFMYFSVIPFTLEGNGSNATTICLARSLSITLSYAATFSLLLGRCILLASVSKEVGFMSHIAGSVQSFMSFFIFGVQCALSTHIFKNCQDLFRGSSFIYMLAYDVILLALSICFCPLVAKSRRNYKEGRYFAITSLMTGCCWSLWIPAYVLLGDEWKDQVLCFGLVVTASIFLSVLFIPRTYLMTIAETKDKLTSALPSLATVTSAIDLYRASTQPVYDCVNIAAINAAAVASSGVLDNQDNLCDFYSAPTTNLDENDYHFARCPTPVNYDKITRF